MPRANDRSLTRALTTATGTSRRSHSTSMRGHSSLSIRTSIWAVELGDKRRTAQAKSSGYQKTLDLLPRTVPSLTPGPCAVVVETTMIQSRRVSPVRCLRLQSASSSRTSRVAASTSPTLTACSHTTCLPATAAAALGDAAQPAPEPARYRPLSSIANSQYGEPMRQNQASAQAVQGHQHCHPRIRPFAALTSSDTTCLVRPTSDDDNQPCMSPHCKHKN